MEAPPRKRAKMICNGHTKSHQMIEAMKIVFEQLTQTYPIGAFEKPPTIEVEVKIAECIPHLTKMIMSTLIGFYTNNKEMTYMFVIDEASSFGCKKIQMGLERRHPFGKNTGRDLAIITYKQKGMVQDLFRLIKDIDDISTFNYNCIEPLDILVSSIAVGTLEDVQKSVSVWYGGSLLENVGGIALEAACICTRPPTIFSFLMEKKRCVIPIRYKESCIATLLMHTTQADGDIAKYLMELWCMVIHVRCFVEKTQFDGCYYLLRQWCKPHIKPYRHKDEMSIYYTKKELRHTQPHPRDRPSFFRWLYKHEPYRIAHMLLASSQYRTLVLKAPYWDERIVWRVMRYLLAIQDMEQIRFLLDQTHPNGKWKIYGECIVRCVTEMFHFLNHPFDSFFDELVKCGISLMDLVEASLNSFDTQLINYMEIVILYAVGTGVLQQHQGEFIDMCIGAINAEFACEGDIRQSLYSCIYGKEDCPKKTAFIDKYDPDHQKRFPTTIQEFVKDFFDVISSKI
jgi:hypothetical protein